MRARQHTVERLGVLRFDALLFLLDLSQLFHDANVQLYIFLL
jgi:hypothetical protein